MLLFINQNPELKNNRHNIANSAHENVEKQRRSDMRGDFVNAISFPYGEIKERAVAKTSRIRRGFAIDSM